MSGILGNFSDLGRLILNRPRTVADQVRPRWFGHDLSGAPDSGIGLSGDGRTHGGRVGRCEKQRGNEGYTA